MAVVAMNGGMGPGPPTDLCNSINQKANRDMNQEEFKTRLKIVPNTPVRTLKTYTTVMVE